MFFSRVRIRPEIFKGSQLSRIISNNPYGMHRLLWDLFPGQDKRNFLCREEIVREQFGAKAGIHGEPVYYLVSSTPPFRNNPLFRVETKEYQPKLQTGDLLGFRLRCNPVVTEKIDREDPDRYLKERSRRKVTNKNKLTKKRVRHDVVMNAKRKLMSSLCSELRLQSRLSATPKNREYKKALLTYGGGELDEKLNAIVQNNFKYSACLHQTMKLPNKLELAIKANVDDALEKWLLAKGEQHGFIISKDDRNQNKIQSSAYRWNSIKAQNGKRLGFSSVDFNGDLNIFDVDSFTKALFEGIGPAKAFGCGLMLVRRI